MSLQKIIITFILVIVFWFFIFNSTYISEEKTKINTSKDYIWYSTLIQNWDKFSTNNLSNEQLWIGKIYIDSINFIDKIYLLWNQKWFYNKVTTNTQTKINIKSWVFLFNLYDLSNNYIIWNDSFILKPSSPWKIYIDTTNQTSTKIFSIDSVVTMDLLDPTTKTKMTQIVLYPRLSIDFNSARNRFLKNADLLRLETLCNIKYTSDEIIDDKLAFNQNFLSKIYPNISKTSNDFLKTSITYIYSDYSTFKSKNSIIKNTSIPGIDYINKYFVFFLNDSKKLAYYKNDIITNINNLLLNPKQAVAVSTQIKSDLDNLKQIDEKEFLDFKKVIEYYYKLSINSTDFDDIETTFVLSNVLHYYKWTTLANKYKSSFYINKIYNLVDVNEFENKDLQDNLIVYLNDFFVWNKIDFDEKKYELKIKDDKVFSDLQYLGFFLKNIIITTLSANDEKSFDSFIKTLWIYYSISVSLDNISANWLTENIIIQNSGLIDMMLKNIKLTFFKPENDEKWFLVLNEKNSISKESLSKLYLIYKKIYNYYFAKKSLLSEKNNIYNNIYDRYDKLFSKYYLALDNYNDYLIKYDETKSQLFTTDSVYSKQFDNSLSLDKLKNYIWFFNWVDLQTLKANIENNNYYSVKEIYISWEKFSFDIYPLSQNKIQNIVKSWYKLAKTYELDSIKNDWDEYAQKYSWDDKDKFDFKNFFINTFFKSNSIQTEQFVTKDEWVKEDKTISIFKRDKLFSDKWDFSVLKPMFDIKYNDVLVNFENNQYSIKILKSLIQASVEIQSENRNIKSNLESDYVFNQNQHYFKNIKLTFIDSDSSDWENIFYLFWWNKVLLNFNINTLEFKEKVPNILKNIYQTNIVYSQINEVFWTTQTDIEYKQDETITFVVKYKQKNIIITCKNWKIISINNAWKNILGNQIIDYSNLWQNLYLLK